MVKGKKVITEDKKKISGCQYGFLLPLLWNLGDTEEYLLATKAWTGNYCMCISVLEVCGHYYRNESGFYSLLFFPL